MYLTTLNSIFHNAERFRSLSKLTLVFYIYKALIGLNDRCLIERMLGDDRYIDTFCILERNLPLRLK